MAVPSRSSTVMPLMRAAAFTVGLALLLVGTLLPLFPDRATIQEGRVATRTLRAPTDLSFTSQILTSQKRDEAMAAVPPVLSYDQSLAQRQLDALTEVSARITQIRSDPDLAVVEKSQALSDLQEVRLSPQGMLLALNLDADAWRGVARESYLVLSAALEQQLSAPEVAVVRGGLRQYISPSRSEDQKLLLEELVRPLVVANLVVDAAATQQVRDAAAAAVEPVVVTLAHGQAIVEQGDVIGATDMEALRAAGLPQSGLQGEELASVVLVALIASGTLGLYLYTLRPGEATATNRLIMLALVIAAWTAGARLLLGAVLPDNDRQFLAYLLPVAAAPMVVASLLGASLAVAVAAVLA
ncbi:MAG: hypothetical protein ACE5IZ_10590, partial [Dehalococcoidia bacterium]